MKLFPPASAIALAVLFVGCDVGSSTDDTSSNSAARVQSPIVGGTSASAYPEATLIDMSINGVIRAACSGSLIAPRVVLTAGHCVSGYTGWRVRAPFANDQPSTSSTAETFDWKDDGTGHVIRDQHDVGLIYLDTAIDLATYPALSAAAVADGTEVVNVGRIKDGVISGSMLYVSKPLAVVGASLGGYPFDYATTQAIESGDSGGPVELSGTTPHTIVAVNSGVGGGAEVLARVDLLKSWIDERIAAHGGPGAATPAPVAAPPAAPAPAPAGCSGTAETEPNDEYTSPDGLTASACGALGEADRQDWYTWSIDGATPYGVKLAPTGDARLAMWKLVDGRYVFVPNTSPTEITHTSSGAGSYVLAVFTRTGADQPYSLALTK